MCVFSRKIRSLGRVSCAGENACRRRTIFIVRSLSLKMKSMRAKSAFSKATANIRTFFNAKGFEEKVLEKFCRSLAARRSCRRRRVKSPAGSSSAAGLVFCPDGRVLGAMRTGAAGFRSVRKGRFSAAFSAARISVRRAKVGMRFAQNEKKPLHIGNAAAWVSPPLGEETHRQRDSNSRHLVLETSALPTELCL